ncbi:unnamed protein product [Camellia sinensis]
MEKSVVTFDKGTTCSSWNYCGERLATGSIDGTLAIFDSVDPASSSFTCTSTSRVHEVSIVKVVWVPSEYGGGVACICADGTLSLWEEVAEDTKPLQWKLCKGFETSSNQVLDMQFGVSFTSLKLVGCCIFKQPHESVRAPRSIGTEELATSVQSFRMLLIPSPNLERLHACLHVSWTPQRGESQQLSFVLGFNSNVMQLNSAKRKSRKEKDLLKPKQPMSAFFAFTTEAMKLLEEEQYLQLKTKKEKDLLKLKQSMSAFFMFTNERRAALLAESNSVAKITGEEWKNMTEKQKKHEKIAKQNKEKYLEEMEQEALQLLKKKEKTDNIMKKMKENRQKKKKIADPNKPKKPASSFLLFRQGRTLKWKELSEEDKQTRNKKAAGAKMELEEYNKSAAMEEENNNPQQ